MVGNDVVDLRDPRLDSRPSRDRFDARICRASECDAIRAAVDPSGERWSHWAAKEAGYKLARKRASATIFSPIRFEVDLAATGADVCASAGRSEVEFRRTGRVVHDGHRIDLVITCRDGAIHAVATWSGESDADLLVDLVRLGDEAPIAPARHSAAVRALAIDRLADRLSVRAERLSIVKRGRIPEIHLDGAPFGADLSLSHHGHVIAFATRIPALRRLERLAS